VKKFPINSDQEVAVLVKSKEELFKELENFIEENGYEGKKDALIQVLHKAQELFGYLPADVLEYISDKLDVPLSKVYGVVTFYNFFSTKPKGKHQIKVCLGTACYVKGADRIFERFLEELKVNPDEPTSDGMFSVHGVRCLGACSMAPVVMVDEDDFYGRVTPDMVPQIISKYKREG
jgi:NADH-quinone oxidoreductase E subunit